jgi:hypothetical protein
MMKCALCGQAISAGDQIAREVGGWEQNQALGATGGSNVIGRQPTGRLAHWSCVVAIKHGVTPGQGSLA